jgi:hypothetical protein
MKRAGQFHRGDGEADGRSEASGWLPSSETPSPDHRRNQCPPMTLRGCAKGLCGNAKASTQLAPNGAISRSVWKSAVSLRHS